ncbi:MAG: gamma-glutamyltransferase [Pseudomonadaceae bacterium]|nr:gamma-glutamyltransferase [Pseudomonadaceae bacterium]
MSSHHPAINVLANLRSILLGGCLALLISQQASAQQAILRYNALHHPTVGQHGMVVSQRELASRIGADVLRDGGNAVDASVAVGFALAVVLPRAGNLGGGGFLLVHVPGQPVAALDFRERAPAAATAGMFLNSDGSVDRQSYRFSHKAVGVPGTVAGLLDAHERYGSKPLNELLHPAIALAADGFDVDYDLASALSAREKLILSHAETARLFRRADGTALRAGDRLQQSDLATTLERIAADGRDGFYKGKVADDIVQEMFRGGGLISHADLASYQATWREPIRGRYRGYDVVSMPPPSSGGVHLVQMLNILSHFPLSSFGAQSSRASHLMIEAMKLAYADRSKHLGDPDFVDVPAAWLTSAEYGRTLAQTIEPDRARASSEIAPSIAPIVESEDTTHYSVVDTNGMAVAVTYTLNFSFGSGISVPGSGFLLNNEMADFSASPGKPDSFGLVTGKANAVAPFKRPLSAMTPTMLLRDGQVRLVTGSPGGSRIINAVLQHVVNFVDFDMNVAEASYAPRLHHQWQPDKLFVERGFPMDSQERLRALGHPVVPSNALGSIQAISYDGERFYGSADTRRPGAAAVAPAGVGDSVREKR